MRLLGIERLVIQPVAHPYHQVWMLGIAQCHIFTYQPITDHLADMQICHHDDGQTISAFHLLGDREVLVAHDGMVDYPIGMDHQSGYAQRNTNEQTALYGRQV